MKFSTKEINAVTILHFEGNMLGGPEASEMNNTLHKLIEAKKKKIVIDLSDVTLMNSSGLGMLIGGVTTMRNAGGDLKIANAAKKISQLFNITKISSVIETYPTVKEAVESFH
ncbi:MAG: STAS domain-containing protein [Bacteroidetes bacterium]|nr:STAS domain-containing protein [Bacteroidota bacterium]